MPEWVFTNSIPTVLLPGVSASILIFGVVSVFEYTCNNSLGLVVPTPTLSFMLSIKRVLPLKL
ncbi:hypothetical protein ES705_31255 [subsurface metagenome]